MERAPQGAFLTGGDPGQSDELVGLSVTESQRAG
jgi:hypothetical protein